MKSWDKAKLVECAKEQVGKPFKWGGEKPAGFDCTGLVSYCFTQAGLPMFHHTAEDLVRYCDEVERPEAGDLVFRRQYNEKASKDIIDHIGVYVGNGKVVSARGLKGKVIVEDYDKKEYNVSARLRPNYRKPSKKGYFKRQPGYRWRKSNRPQSVRLKKKGKTGMPSAKRTR